MSSDLVDFCVFLLVKTDIENLVLLAGGLVGCICIENHNISLYFLSCNSELYCLAIPSLHPSLKTTKPGMVMENSKLRTWQLKIWGIYLWILEPRTSLVQNIVFFQITNLWNRARKLSTPLRIWFAFQRMSFVVRPPKHFSM